VFAIDSSPGSGMVVSAISNSGSGLTWNLLNVENHTDGTIVGGLVEVFWAYNANAQTGITVSATFNVRSKGVTPPLGGLQVLVVDNARADQSTAASTATWNIATSSAPTGTVTTTADRSLVMGVMNNWDGSTTPTLPAGQTITSIIYNPVDGDTYWIQSNNSATPTPSAVTIYDTAPSNIRWHQITWEILAA
jgi:hypothetical protein